MASQWCRQRSGRGASSISTSSSTATMCCVAEGAPAESFVDRDSRMMFHNAAEFAALYPDAEPATATLRDAGRGWRSGAPHLAADRGSRGHRRGQGVAARTASMRCRAERGGLGGGEVARRSGSPLSVDGMPVARGLANRFRPDLAASEIGRGWHGFRILLARALDPAKPHRVSVRREADGVELPGSPVIVPAGGRRPPRQTAGGERRFPAISSAEPARSAHMPDAVIVATARTPIGKAGARVAQSRAWRADGGACRSAMRWSAPASSLAPSRRWCWAAGFRRARPAATSRGWRRSAPGCRSRPPR